MYCLLPAAAVAPLAALLLCMLSSVSGSNLVLRLGDRLDPADYDAGSDLVAQVYSLDLRGDEVAAAETLELPTGEILTFDDVPLDEGGYRTYGFKHEATSAEAELTVGEELDDVNGDVTDEDGRAYEIAYEGDGKHVWLVMNMDRLEEMDGADDEFGDDDARSSDGDLFSLLSELGVPREAQEAALARGQDRSADGEVADISVKVYFTRDYEAKTEDVRGAVENVLAVANQGFENSGVDVRLSLLCMERYLGDEVGSLSSMMGRFDRYKATRERLHGTSDLTLLLVSIQGRRCGIAAYGLSSFPLAVVEKYCAETYHSVTHEFGHNFGANHDAAHTTRKGYNRGYQMDNGKRTIMAYDSDDGKHSRKVNYFSDDEGSDAEGDHLGTADADNSRYIQSRRFAFSLIGNESAECDWTFEPDMTEGVRQWSSWINYGCPGHAAMYRVNECATEYFNCTTPEDYEMHDCGNCTDEASDCSRLARRGACSQEDKWEYMVVNCTFSCPDICEEQGYNSSYIPPF